MKTIKRRTFLKSAVLFCPCLFSCNSTLLTATENKENNDLIVLGTLCTGCGDCIETCPVDAITIKKKIAFINNEDCIQCDGCISECPVEAILYKKDLEAYKKAHPEKFKEASKK